MPSIAEVHARARRTYVDKAAQQLTEWIVTARYPLHSRLPPERKLVELLQLPRGQLREALKVLEDQGRIWRRVGMGTFVGSRPQSIHSRPESLGSATTLNELLEARYLIEPVVARLAAQRVEKADLALIEQYFGKAGKAQTWEEWAKWDGLFHRAISEASGNGILINAIDQLFRMKNHSRWTLQRHAAFDPSVTARYTAEHEAVVSCIVARDPEGAEAAMRRHMSGLGETVGPMLTKSLTKQQLRSARFTGDRSAKPAPQGEPARFQSDLRDDEH